MVFKKSNIFTFSNSQREMNENYAEIRRVGNFEADFQQVLLVQFFWNFHNIVVKHQ